ncbi:MULTISPECIES: tRNA pseudouridine(38-40) synthase TruA [unclassified Paenibacillus]|uniref:tRNA pseudouridine(38-40) synthase TruA n=1 Tax=unclassified Paenibacillus TaxID=185978 RepID=UPI000955E810|nr:MULTISPECIES: tRNA pseudouridine(38-40) synthase TruA [unclassified Paenibacillus]ASS68236.1 tRNA pseudouridine(38-40) synthase TruA [Paenibacillus sp. RUD330]SIR71044.1 tRNA pseudouridine38-40 synthase [Paenibacillus sp. RU4X]SIR78335.1 tRNA pseudouridine38-40 synthase [Paenibacillus sp. RU4T]
MRNIRMKVAYDGTAYSGFQSQPGGNTVQDVIEQAIEVLTDAKTHITASGRTDARVHALGQVFNFYTEAQIAVERWSLALNSRLPSDIRIVENAVEVPLEFHSRYAAKRKTYRYSIYTGKFNDVFRRNYHFHHPAPQLNVGAMRRALEYIVGEHDFTSFTTVHSDKTSHVRTIYEAELRQEGPNLDLYLTGNGFLYNMVRIITGTLLLVGKGKLDPDSMGGIILAKNRQAAGPTAVPYGLTLVEVDYGEQSCQQMVGTDS